MGKTHSHPSLKIQQGIVWGLFLMIAAPDCCILKLVMKLHDIQQAS